MRSVWLALWNVVKWPVWMTRVWRTFGMKWIVRDARQRDDIKLGLWWLYRWVYDDSCECQDANICPFVREEALRHLLAEKNSNWGLLLIAAPLDDSRTHASWTHKSGLHRSGHRSSAAVERARCCECKVCNFRVIKWRQVVNRCFKIVLGLTNAVINGFICSTSTLTALSSSKCTESSVKVQRVGSLFR